VQNPCRRLSSHGGYSLLEIVVVVGLIGVISAIAVPMMANSLGYLRLSGDARNVSNAIALSKMRAASIFSRTRIVIDLSGESFHVETFDHTTAICCWNVDGGTTHLSQNVTFNFGVVGAPPPNAQATIGQPAPCLDNTGAVIANRSCILFNSRGVPVDSTGTSGVVTAVYLTDGSAVYGVTVSATGMVRSWKTQPLATPSWSLQ
jgi:prepilin-type N-terminal cleavage/methylation domain-containing protein